METRQGYYWGYEEALHLAIQNQVCQERDESDALSIVHRVQVSRILQSHGFSTDVAIAGLLHDIVQNQGYESIRIAWQFGQGVAEMVDAVTERKMDKQFRKLPRDECKWEALERLRLASDGAVALKVADTLHHISRSKANILRWEKDAEEQFGCGIQSVLMYHREILWIAQERLGYHSLVRELESTLDDLKRMIEEMSTGNEDAYVGVDNQLDKPGRIWISISPHPRVIGGIPADVLLN